VKIARANVPDRGPLIEPLLSSRDKYLSKIRKLYIRKFFEESRRVCPAHEGNMWNIQSDESYKTFKPMTVVFWWKKSVFKLRVLRK
jgi:hypothetical protein